MGWAGPRPIVRNFDQAGPNRGPSSGHLMGRAGPQTILSKFDGPGRAAAREIWPLYGPLRPAHQAAHVF